MCGQIKIIRDELLLLILLDHPTNISASLARTLKKRVTALSIMTPELTK